MGLYDGILIKDNHLAALRKGVRAVAEQAQAWRQRQQSLVPLEIEVDSLEQLDEVLGCRPDIVLLDNMTPEQLRDAVRRRNEKAPGVVLEASGGVTLETVRALAETGVDRISIGALTHSAPALDIALRQLLLAHVHELHPQHRLVRQLLHRLAPHHRILRHRVPRLRALELVLHRQRPLALRLH